MISPPNYSLRSCNQNPSTQNIVSSQNAVDKPVIIIPSPAGIVQAAKMRKIVDGLEGRVKCVLPTQEYVRQIFENASDDDDYTRGWKLEKIVAVIKSCTPNVLGDLTVTLKDPSDQEELTKLLEKVEKAEQELQFDGILSDKQANELRFVSASLLFFSPSAGEAAAWPAEGTSLVVAADAFSTTVVTPPN
nr:RNA recognition motif domain, nucleotide-binding alpha-beta plait domain protein [Tanacetum cinerariifolium]